MAPKNTSVIAIVGPTCTGKTDLSIELAQKLNGEIIALDSRTIYKKMDIGTAKPSKNQQETVKHHAIDILEPNRFFTVAEYVKVATEAINTIFSKNKTPILCGGTGLYARALLEGIQIPAVAPQTTLREELNQFADQNGNLALHERLNELDPVSANRLNPNDRRRIIRALEVSIISGQPFSQLAHQTTPPFNTIWIGLNWQNRTLHKELITKRLQLQLSAGLLKEVEELCHQTDYRDILNNSVNYKEFIPYFEKTINLDEASAQCIQNNFQLARKQMIWFRARKMINWLTLDSSNQADLLNQSLKLLDS